eukprot:m.23035 g.23035  ORF g.23035 m.23035 type:complete len:78 (+) comp8443_c0_seq1:1795-2028(+)
MLWSLHWCVCVCLLVASASGHGCLHILCVKLVCANAVAMPLFSLHVSIVSMTCSFHVHRLCTFFCVCTLIGVALPKA